MSIRWCFSLGVGQKVAGTDPATLHLQPIRNRPFIPEISRKIHGRRQLQAGNGKFAGRHRIDLCPSQTDAFQHCGTSVARTAERWVCLALLPTIDSEAFDPILRICATPTVRRSTISSERHLCIAKCRLPRQRLQLTRKAAGSRAVVDISNKTETRDAPKGRLNRRK